jgi:TonB family protein
MTSRLATTILLLIAFVSFVAAQVVPQRVRVSEGVAQGLLIKKVNPIYPPLARQARIQGTVILQLQIDKAGGVQNVQLFSGHPMLAPAAIEAVKQWKYTPYLLNGDPIAMETKARVNFTLSDEPEVRGIVGDAPGGLPEGQPGGLIQSPQPQTPGASNRVRISSRVSQALLVTKVAPQYPPDAKDQHIQGVVLLQAIIDKEGNVSKVQLISGHPLLAPSAIEAVKQWKYKPYLLNRIPVEVETQVQVNFTLVN